MFNEPDLSPSGSPPPPTGCCPPVDPMEWERKEIVWKNEPFLRTVVPSILHVPLRMGRKITRAMAQIEGAGVAPDRGIMLSKALSPWLTELLIHVKNPVPGGDMVYLSGTFLTRIFDGPYRDSGKWAKEMERHVASQGRKIQKLYFAYTTCPSCAKAYGHNYVVLFARV